MVKDTNTQKQKTQTEFYNPISAYNNLDNIQDAITRFAQGKK